MYSENELPEEYKLSWPLRNCVREGDKTKKLPKKSTEIRESKNASRVASNSSQNEVEQKNHVELPIVPSRPVVSPEIQPKLQIHVPTAEYEEETDELTEQESVNYDELIEKYKRSDESLGELPGEEQDELYEYASETF